jgi:hypothetical protein
MYGCLKLSKQGFPELRHGCPFPTGKLKALLTFENLDVVIITYDLRGLPLMLATVPVKTDNISNY